MKCFIIAKAGVRMAMNIEFHEGPRGNQQHMRVIERPNKAKPLFHHVPNVNTFLSKYFVLREQRRVTLQSVLSRRQQSELVSSPTVVGAAEDHALAGLVSVINPPAPQDGRFHSVNNQNGRSLSAEKILPCYVRVLKIRQSRLMQHTWHLLIPFVAPKSSIGGSVTSDHYHVLDNDWGHFPPSLSTVFTNKAPKHPLEEDGGDAFGVEAKRETISRYSIARRVS